MVVFLAAGAFAEFCLVFVSTSSFTPLPLCWRSLPSPLSDIASRQSIGVIVIIASVTVASLQIGYLGGRVLNVAASGYLSAATGIRNRTPAAT